MIKHFYTKHKTILFFIFLFVLLRIPSFFEPYWGNDDGLYATIATEMQNGKVLYTDVFDHKPPLIFYTYFFGTGLNKLFYSKLLNLISGLIALIGVHILSKELINSEKHQKISLGIFTALLATPIIQGTSVNAENYFITFSIWALIFVLKKKSKWHLFTAGSLFAIGFSYKFHPILEAASIGLFLAVEDGFNRKALKNTFKEKLLPYSAGFITTFTMIFALVTKFKNISDYIYANYTFSALYSISYKSGLFYSFKFKVIFISLLISALIFQYSKNKISKKTLLLSMLFLTSLLATTISGKGFVHYYIQLIPYFALISGLVFKNRYQLIKNKLLIFLSIYAILVFGLLSRSNQPHYESSYTDYEKYLEVFRYYTAFADSIANSDPIIFDEFFHYNHQWTSELTISVEELNPKSIYIYETIGWHYLLVDMPISTKYINSYHNILSTDVAKSVVKELQEKDVELIVMSKRNTPDIYIQKLLKDEYEVKKEGSFFLFYIRKY